MIPKSKSTYNLAPYLSTAIIDSNQQYFQVFEFPEKFAIGKNSFRLKANSGTLAIGSPVFIDIRDTNNNPIYFEVLNKKTQDSSRIVVVHIDKNLPDGNCTVLIGGIVRETRNWDLGPNVLLYRIVPLTTSAKTQSPIIFENPPTIQVTEIRTSYEKLTSTANRAIQTKASPQNTITILAPQVGEEFLNKSKILDQTDESFIVNVLDPKKSQKVFYSSLSGSLGPRTINKTFGNSNESRYLPKFTDLPVVTTILPFFSKSMEGGQIILNRIVPRHLIPGDVQNVNAFAITNFSASIIRVINSQIAQIDNILYKPVKYKNTQGQNREVIVDSIYDHRNFSASYVGPPTLQVTKISESFAVFDVKNLDPAGGSIDKIHVKYKPIGSFGDFKDAGEFRVYKQNLLSDRLNYLLTDTEGYVEKPIGKITNSSDLNAYWSSHVVGGGTVSLYRDIKQVYEGVGIVYNPPTGNPDTSYAVVSTYSRYYFECVKNTEYTLEFRFFAESKGIADERIPQLDIYVSGSNVTAGVTSEKNTLSPISSPSLGTFITSISNDRNGNQKISVPFKTLDDGYTKFNFVVRSGNWVVGDLTVTPNVMPGYTPNQVRFNIPVDRFDTNSELALLVEYYDSFNKKAELESKVYGVYFTGSYKPEFSGSVSYSGSIPIAKYDQTTPSTTWTFPHNLNQLYPVVTVYGDDDKVIIPQEIIAQDSNTLIVTFPVALTGTIVAAGGNFVNISGSCCPWDNIPSKPPGIVSGSSQIDYKSIENVPVGILSSSFQISTEISGAFESTAIDLANATSILSSSLESRIIPLEYSTVNTYYRGTYIGATSTKPKLFHREALVGSYEVEKVYIYISASNATFSKAEFYFTSGSLLTAYDPRSNSDYDSTKQIGKVTMNTVATGYTSSVWSPTGWVIRNGINGMITFFVSASANSLLNNNSFTTAGLILKRL